MVQITEAIFTDGVLKPVEDIDLAEGQRVRLVVEPIDNQSGAEAPTKRAMALEKLLAGIEGMAFCSTGPLPSRGELHDRF